MVSPDLLTICRLKSRRGQNEVVRTTAIPPSEFQSHGSLALVSFMFVVSVQLYFFLTEVSGLG